MKVVSVVGARPQFVKAALLSPSLAGTGIDEVLVHSGQHYDYVMSQVFFDQLGLRAPDHELAVGSGSHARQTAAILERLDPVLVEEVPDVVLVYGDTNTTLAAALCAAQRRLPVAHVEAGLRSFNRAMPEEMNRVVADHLATLCFAPSASAAQQLANEGIASGVHVVGDLMIDLVLRTAEALAPRPPILEQLGLEPATYAVATVHRAANTDDPSAFEHIIGGLRRTGMRVIFPVHPRTRALVERFGVGLNDDPIRPIDPLPYVAMVGLVARARVVLTDSGGLQKEAGALGVPCVTLREETEWTATVRTGWNVLAGTDPNRIAALAWRRPPHTAPTFDHPAGDCAAAIARVLRAFAPARVGSPA
jgi:UDP-GlcNAc3NAcA epimerase